MDDQLLVDLIELENENIVNIVEPEDLNGKPSAKKYEDQGCQEVVSVHAWIDLFPQHIIRWTKDEEDEEWNSYGKGTTVVSQ